MWCDLVECSGGSDYDCECGATCWCVVVDVITILNVVRLGGV